MILHCVFCRFRDDASRPERTELLEELAAFSRGLDGVLAFDFGPNRDFEGKSEGYGEGFVIRFRNRAALDHYATHATHRDLGARLADLCEDGARGIMVFDLEVQSSP